MFCSLLRCVLLFCVGWLVVERNNLSVGVLSIPLSLALSEERATARV